jgi:hypothetical protein
MLQRVSTSPSSLMNSQHLPTKVLRKRYRKNYRSRYFESVSRPMTTMKAVTVKIEQHFSLFTTLLQACNSLFFFKGESEKTTQFYLFCCFFFDNEKNLEKISRYFTTFNNRPTFEEIVQNWNPSAISMLLHCDVELKLIRL